MRCYTVFQIKSHNHIPDYPTHIVDVQVLQSCLSAVRANKCENTSAACSDACVLLGRPICCEVL